MRRIAWILAGAIALPLAPLFAAEDDGANAVARQIPWARWQGRLSLVTATDPWRLGVEGPTIKLSSATLMGDYYFGRSRTGTDRAGGLRATSGIIFGPRFAPTASPPGAVSGNAFSIDSRSAPRAALPPVGEAAPETATLPYLGIGYTGLSARNGWGFSADLGLIAKSPATAARYGRGTAGGQSLDDVVRDIRMTPLLQLGVSYSF
jgi:hypothetical protein